MRRRNPDGTGSLLLIAAAAGVAWWWWNSSQTAAPAPVVPLAPVAPSGPMYGPAFVPTNLNQTAQLASPLLNPAASSVAQPPAAAVPSTPAPLVAGQSYIQTPFGPIATASGTAGSFVA